MFMKEPVVKSFWNVACFGVSTFIAFLSCIVCCYCHRFFWTIFRKMVLSYHFLFRDSLNWLFELLLEACSLFLPILWSGDLAQNYFVFILIYFPQYRCKILPLYVYISDRLTLTHLLQLFTTAILPLSTLQSALIVNRDSTNYTASVNV